MVNKDLSFRSFADLQSLDGLKRQAKENDPQALKTVAKQFESLFLNMLMQNMRKANDSFSAGSYFDSNQTKFYRDMLDQQLSLSLSSGKGVGISEVLVRQLSPTTSATAGVGAGGNAQSALAPLAATQLFSETQSGTAPSSPTQSMSPHAAAANTGLPALDASTRLAIEALARKSAPGEGLQPSGLPPARERSASREPSALQEPSALREPSALQKPSELPVRSALPELPENQELPKHQALPGHQALPELRPGAFVEAMVSVAAQARQQLEARAVAVPSSRTSDVAKVVESMAEAPVTVNNAAGSAVDSSADGFSTPEEYVQRIYPLAVTAAAEMGLDPRVLVAQSALETGWGRHLPRNADGSNSFNLFGIKADRRWQGDAALVSTLEFRQGIAAREQAAFRSYESYQESLQDYVQFIRSNPRYQQALEQVSDGEAYLQQLQQAGYATDPRYAGKIAGILSGEILQTALSAIQDS